MRGASPTLEGIPGACAFLRAAFLQESGEALIRKHAGVDPLFARERCAEYAEDLLARMTNPYQLDTVERVGRDPARKLGWNDRLVGTMRMALEQGIEPRRNAWRCRRLGGIGAIGSGESAPGTRAAPPSLGAASPPQREQEAVIDRMQAGLRQVRAWRSSGFSDLEDRFSRGSDV